MTNKKSGVIFMIHCPQGIGYAIGRLVEIFKLAAEKSGYSEDRVFFSYIRVSDNEGGRLLECDYNNVGNKEIVKRFIRDNNIKYAVAFDLNYPSVILPVLKQAGVSKIISYWGARISSQNNGVKLSLKRLEWYFRRNKPDFYIFESRAMQKTATHGRGIPVKNTCVVPLGVDTEKFLPSNVKNYIYQELEIPVSRAVIFYSGHMEERKGVHVIINAAIELIDNRDLSEIHFVICGNLPGEEKPFIAMLNNKKAEQHVTFAGYREDIEQLMASATLGVIASTGWDSFTMSSVEMMASGLPLIVSDLEGLSETIVNGDNGYLFSPGNVIELADSIQELVSNEVLQARFSKASRDRAVDLFSKDKQVKRLSEIMNKIF